MSIPEFIVAVPARFSASRLPGKPLRLLGGEPIVRHVVRRALAAGAGSIGLQAPIGRRGEGQGGSGVGHR
jgi:3-deoxy-manno-octulosonate cytidylyltransferase (CMP-KDO synthetase)